jgi:hypothetical protein
MFSTVNQINANNKIDKIEIKTKQKAKMYQLHFE